VNRGNIVNTSGISVNQSSTGINRYIGLVPESLTYNKSARTYVRTEAFHPKFLKQSAASYFSKRRSLADGVIEMSNVRADSLPDFDATPSPGRGG